MTRVSDVISKVVIFDEFGNILLIRRSKTDKRRPLELDLPGGWVDDGEDYNLAAIREVEEETGFKILKKDTQLAFSMTDMTDFGSAIWLYYVARVQNAEPTLSSEHDEYKWVKPDEALKIVTYKRQNDALRYIFTNNLKPLEQK